MGFGGVETLSQIIPKVTTFQIPPTIQTNHGTDSCTPSIPAPPLRDTRDPTPYPYHTRGNPTPLPPYHPLRGARPTPLPEPPYLHTLRGRDAWRYPTHTLPPPHRTRDP